MLEICYDKILFAKHDKNIQQVTNSIDIDGELNINNNNKNISFNTNQTCSNLSIFNFNLESLINCFVNNIQKEKGNKFIIEWIEKKVKLKRISALI